MAENNNNRFTPSDNIYLKLCEKYSAIREEALRLNIQQSVLRNILLQSEDSLCVNRKLKLSWRSVLCCLTIAILLGGLWNVGWNFGEISRAFLSSRCLLQNNFIIMEISRPITDCNICQRVDNVLILENVTKDVFAQYAYLSRPLLVKGATKSWNATKTFNFEFFKHLYTNTEGAFESVEDECQFFPFRTDFVTLRDVFAMSSARARGLEPQNPWYIGWSNCNPQVMEVLRKHYSRPHFLPTDSESSAIDWIFMGWPGRGASIHLDYVQRPSWQAQISGRKTWRLFPTPECEDVCRSFTIVVEKGDIVLIDTNQWYHDTSIEPGEISITIGSEYD